jgi:hypothetical protein
MARNFAEESMDITQPRIDRRNESNGITGSHFPLFEWQLAGIYKVTGEHYIVARLYSALIFAMAMFAMYLLLIQLGVKTRTALLGGLALLSIPQFYYDSINAMPDIYALALALLSAVFVLRDSQQSNSNTMMAVVVLASLAGMIKFQFLIIPLSFFGFYKISLHTIIRLSLYTSIIVTPVILWYQHAMVLTELNNLKEFGLWIKPISNEQKIATVSGNLLSDMPELLLGYPLLTGLFIIVFKQRKNLQFSALGKTSVLWLAGFIVFYIIAIERMMHHSYYFMALLPLAVILLVKLYVKGVWHLKYLYLLVGLNFIWSAVRIIPSRWVESKRQIPVEFADQDSLKLIRQAIPKHSKCLVGPDKSGCIYFYFTDTEGYSFEDPQELLSTKVEGRFMDILEKAGVRYIICDQAEMMDKVMTQLPEWHEYRAVGAFKIWTHR